MNYRHIKRICKGESQPVFDLVQDGSRSMADIALFSCVCDVVYCPDRLFAVDDHCLYSQHDPTYWFYRYDSPITYFIGVPLKSIVRTLLESADHPRLIWGTPVSFIFRMFIRHIRWELEESGIKCFPADTVGLSKVNDYNIRHTPELVYGIMSKIFINYTKKIAKWQMK